MGGRSQEDGSSMRDNDYYMGWCLWSMWGVALLLLLEWISGIELGGMVLPGGVLIGYILNKEEEED